MENQDSISNLPWTIKYTPKTFEDFHGNSMTVQILNSYLKKQNLPSLLFYGPPGTGKTSLSQLIYTSFYTTSVSSMVLKINTTEDVRMETLQKRIIQFATTRNLFQNTKKKLIFVDDSDNMIAEMQILFSDMIDLLEKDVFFIFCSNNQSSFSTRFTSRVLSVLVPPISIPQVSVVIKKILVSENLNLRSIFADEEKSIRRLYSVMGGDLRKIINCVQALYSCTDMSSSDNNDVMVLSKSLIDTIFLFHQQEDLQVFISILYEKELKDAVQFLSDRISKKSQDFRVWMRLVFEYILCLPHIRLSQYSQYFIHYVTNLSEVDYNTSFVVDFRVQLYAFVTLTRQLLHTILPKV